MPQVEKFYTANIKNGSQGNIKGRLCTPAARGTNRFLSMKIDGGLNKYSQTILARGRQERLTVVDFTKIFLEYNKPIRIPRYGIRHSLNQTTAVTSMKGKSS